MKKYSNKLFDNIYIWSKNELISLKKMKNINVILDNIGTIHDSIIDDIKKNFYKNKVLIVQKSMFIHKKFINLINNIEYPENYHILQLGLLNGEKNIKYDKIISLGAYILNLETVNLNKFNWRCDYNYPNKIYSISEPLFINIMYFNQIKNFKKIISNYLPINIKLLSIQVKNIYNLKNNIFDNVEQIYISKCLEIFSSRIKLIYNLNNYTDINKPALFFGIYNFNDLNILQKHQHKKYIIWGGTDINDNLQNEKSIHKILINKVKQINIEKHFAISKCISDRLNKHNLNHILINFNLVDWNLFNIPKKLGNNIYIYNGHNKTDTYIYGNNIYKKIIKKFPEYNFILSNTINIPYNKIYTIYQKCFIGLRLTNKDGNANTVQEMNAMNIPVIHNGTEENSLHWNTEEDIELLIRYRNIDIFNNSISQYNNLLFICSGFPNYGGAATNTLKLIKYYKSKKNIYGIFFINDEVETKYIDNNIIIVNKSRLQKILYNLDFKPDLIILRNYINFSLKEYFKCPIYFFIPGIFTPNLDKHYNTLTTEQIKKYIHKDIIKTIKKSKKSFCASYHTQQILKNIYKLETNILYFNYIPYHNKFIIKDDNFDERKYDYGIIVSNFNRKVKNISSIINKIKNTKYKVILIGKNSNHYNYSNFTCYDLLNNTEIIKYMKQIKIILQNSFYESCSNVYVESRFCGCLIKNNLNDDNKNNYQILKKNKISIKDTCILVTSTQYPYYGGSATCAYHSISYLRNIGYKCCGIFFDNNKNVNIDPDNIGGIIRIEIRPGFILKKKNKIPLIKQIIYSYFNGSYPDIIFGWNYGAPIITRQIFNSSKIVYVITGIPSLTLGNSSVESNLSVNKILTSKDKNSLNKNLLSIETKCINNSDICLPYTKLIENFYKFIYPNKLTKLHSFLNTGIGNVIEHTQIHNLNKKYDLIAVSSNWYRKVKNLDFLLKIYSQYPLLNKIIIGLEDKNDVKEQYKNLYKLALKIKNLTILPLIDYDKVQQLISQSKIMVVPSYSESGPNVILEALLQKCQVITSKNIGFYNYLNEYNLCQDVYNITEYIYKINYILTNFNKLDFPQLDKFVDKEKIKMKNFINDNILIDNRHLNILFICCDIPNIGGAATNTYNIMKALKNIYNCYGIFISNLKGKSDPENIGNIDVIILLI